MNSAMRSPALVVRFQITHIEHTRTVTLEGFGERTWGGVRWRAQPVTIAEQIERRELHHALEHHGRQMHDDYIQAMRALQGTRWGRHL